MLVLASRSPPLLTRISRLQTGFCGGQSPTPPKGSLQHPALSELCPRLPRWEGAAGVHGKARGRRGASPPAVQLGEQLSARPLDHPTLLQRGVMRAERSAGSTPFPPAFALSSGSRRRLSPPRRELRPRSHKEHVSVAFSTRILKELPDRGRDHGPQTTVGRTFSPRD